MTERATTEGTAKIIYILYLVGIVFGITALIGVVMAYVNKEDAPGWVKSHYQFQIRTFWIGMLLLVLGAVLAFVLIGYLVFLFWIIWVVIRCVKGMKFLDQGRAHPSPLNWFF